MLIQYLVFVDQKMHPKLELRKLDVPSIEKLKMSDNVYILKISKDFLSFLTRSASFNIFKINTPLPKLVSKIVGVLKIAIFLKNGQNDLAQTGIKHNCPCT